MKLQKDTAPYTKNIYKIFKHISYADNAHENSNNHVFSDSPED